jgi:hypothetical protein
MNIILRGITLEELEEYLTGRGWKIITVSGDDQFIPDPNVFAKRSQDIQVGFGSMDERVHLRLWEFQHEIIGSIHKDQFSFRGHVAVDFESAERFFALVCEANPNWIVKQDEVEMNNRIAGYRQPYNNGRATLVEKNG